MKTENKIQHTPGTWKYFISPLVINNGMIEPGGGRISAPTDERIFGRDPMKTITYLPHWYKNDGQAEIEANAQLISASPDLLEALKFLLETFEEEVSQNEDFDIKDTTDQGDWMQSILKARSAINKATGK